MLAEYTLKYRIADEMEDFMAQVEVSCQTELENVAYEALKTSRAEMVNFNFVREDE